jgi:hypothetical protein
MTARQELVKLRQQRLSLNVTDFASLMAVVSPAERERLASDPSEDIPTTVRQVRHGLLIICPGCCDLATPNAIRAGEHDHWPCGRCARQLTDNESPLFPGFCCECAPR